MDDQIKRAKCPNCLCPEVRCLCTFCKKDLTPPFPVIILRHKDEKNHYLNTAKILDLSLTDINVFDGEIFTETIYDNFKTIKNWVLLFPSDRSIPTIDFKKSSISRPIEGVIVIDGTWKKAKKIYYLNSFLHSLPSVKLSTQYTSQYELRRCGKENFLSTIEALAYFFNEYQEDVKSNDLKNELISRFNKMIQQQTEIKKGFIP